ncbi:MAG: LemA family protein, partial [Longimicrobiaceae bacterium]
MRIQTVVVLLLAGFSLSGCGYNRIQALDERTEELKSNIGVELTNRNQLIPNLVATVQGAAEFERGTFTEVAGGGGRVRPERQQGEKEGPKGER